VENIIREMFLSSLELSRRVLIEAGLSREDANHTIKVFAEGDRHRLYEDFIHFSDDAKMVDNAKRHAQDLAELFETDAEAIQEDIEAEQEEIDKSPLPPRRKKAKPGNAR